MKRLIILTILASFLLPAAARAQAGGPMVEIETPPEIFSQICAKPVWQGITAEWKGTKDGRDQKAVGIQVKGDDEPIQVFANPPIEAAFDGALREIFRQCGMNLVKSVPDEGMRISAEVGEFYVDVMKNTVTGKSRGQSLLRFLIDKGGSFTTVDTGIEIDAKDVRRGKIKALVTAVNKLFAETLKQVPATKQLQEIK